MSFGMLGSEHYVDLLFNGLKVVEGIAFPSRKQLHNNDINHGCVVVNVTKVFNGDIQLSHASRGADTLLEEKVFLLNGMHHRFFNHIDCSLQHVELKEITGVDSNSGDKNILHESRFSFLLTKVRLLHRCLDHRDCIAIGLVTNVDENDSIEGKFWDLSHLVC
jgi:hypothetical protein